MFRLIGTNAEVTLWDQDHEIPTQLQNELLQLEDDLTMYALGDTSLGWGYLIINTSDRSDATDSNALRDLETKYLDMKRVTPTPKRTSRPSATYH